MNEQQMRAFADALKKPNQIIQNLGFAQPQGQFNAGNAIQQMMNSGRMTQQQFQMWGQVWNGLKQNPFFARLMK